jgi:hypothetical protein
MLLKIKNIIGFQITYFKCKSFKSKKAPIDPYYITNKESRSFIKF